MASSPTADWRQELPYSALVYVRDDHNGVPHYLVAGSALSARSAPKALREALTVHGGHCFYCNKTATTLDHVDPKARGGSDRLHNLVLACTSCNISKGVLPVEAFNRNAGRSWLLAAHAMIEARLKQIQD